VDQSSVELLRGVEVVHEERGSNWSAGKVSSCGDESQTLPNPLPPAPLTTDTASKGAVLAMTRELAMVHAREGIRFNALCP
jgi:NAD(P)-dependent dehydrogenase (short-subunit alcohol dehydrogenase family)